MSKKMIAMLAVSGLALVACTSTTTTDTGTAVSSDAMMVSSDSMMDSSSSAPAMMDSTAGAAMSAGL